MAKQLFNINNFGAGFSASDKSGPVGSFFFAQNLDIFTDPNSVTINPKTIKESGTTFTALPKWIVSGTPYDTNIYFYDAGGNIIKRTSAGAYSNIRAVASSSGQGLELHSDGASQDYLYYTQNTQVGRYGPLDGAATFTDNWKTGLNDTSSTGFAPIKDCPTGLAVGNGNNLSWWDGAVWTQNKLTLPQGYNVRALELIDEYLAIAAWKGTTITASEDSYIFFWDMTSTTFNFFTRSNEGAVNSMLNFNNELLCVVGSSGKFYKMYPTVSEVNEIPLLKLSNYCEFYPGAVTNWKNIAHLGGSANTDSTDIYNGVYQYVNKNNLHPEGFNFGFTLSTGDTVGTTMKIGAVKGIGNQLFIGWKAQDGSFGVDRVLQTNNPFATGMIQFLWFDNNVSMMEKMADTFKAGHLPLRSGESVQIGYKVDRSANFSTPQTANSTVGDVTTKFPIKRQDARFHELQTEVLLGAGTTAPKLTGMSLKYDDLMASESFGKK